jgi:integrase
LQRYAADVSPGKRGGRWEVIRLKAFGKKPLDAFVAHPVGQIAENHVAAWRDRRLKSVGPATVRREMNLLAAVFELARREWKWVRSNPFRDVRKPTEPPARRRGVKDSELSALKARAETEAEREVILGFELGIETGMRAGEMWGLGPEQITGSVAHLEQTKNGDERDVALSPRAVEIVTGLLADDRPQLFTISNAVRDVLFRRLRDAAGLPDLHFHDSRSEAVSRLSKRLDVLELAEQIGHRDLNSLQSYYRQPASERALRLSEPQTKRSPRKPPIGASRRSRG